MKRIYDIAIVDGFLGVFCISAVALGIAGIVLGFATVGYGLQLAWVSLPWCTPLAVALFRLLLAITLLAVAGGIAIFLGSGGLWLAFTGICTAMDADRKALASNLRLPGLPLTLGMLIIAANLTLSLTTDASDLPGRGVALAAFVLIVAVPVLIVAVPWFLFRGLRALDFGVKFSVGAVAIFLFVLTKAILSVTFN